MSGTELFIQPDGQIKCLYTDLIDLSRFGKLHVERASHVEFDDIKQTWTVRLAGSGKVIGDGFESRQEALDFEVDYLNRGMSE